MLKFSKKSQLEYKGKKKPKKEGSKTEAPVQAFINTYLNLKGLDFFRVPDKFWRWVHNPYSKMKIQYKVMCSDAFSGWPDNMIFEVLTDKYLIALPLEAKSRTGKFNGNRQRNMGKRMHYQIPRSGEQARKIIDKFMKDTEKLRDFIEKEGLFDEEKS